MPVIALASPHSNTGKTTAAQLPAHQLARSGPAEIVDAGAGRVLSASP